MRPVQPLILASTSPYRRELLARLGLAFDVVAPQVDEAPQPGEAPAALALRLAICKAEAVAARHPQAWVIGSDQVAELDGRALGKPGTHANAVSQWQAMRGRTLVFRTAVALAGPGALTSSTRIDVSVQARNVDDATIERYLRAEQPYDCAGSAKVEGLGIAMLERVESDDPTALIGLPLIATARMLRTAGFQIP